jgi:hypothetical protein
MRSWRASSFFLLVSSVLSYPNISISLDGATALHRYDGHGGLSAGASSRLLWDYGEPQRSQILDYLFRPSFGAGMHMLKVEIGGDAQSTDGTEPSHQHTRDDLSCNRGYEFWLLAEARSRNPAIATFGLMWGAPGWINDGVFYGPDMINYTLRWLDCAVVHAAGPIDYLGLHNEAAQPTVDYVVTLRRSLDAGGHALTKIVVMDNAYYNTDEVAAARANATYRAAIGVAGLHDPCSYNYSPQPSARELGWALWASEDFSRDVSGWQDSQNYWGKALSQHYVQMNITSTISWSLLWSVYSNLICRDSGLMKARWPWSGYYEVQPTIWLHAHWGQFVEPGWKFLHVPGGGSGFLTLSGAPLHGGTYVSLVPPQGGGLTVIIETMADASCLHRNLSHFELTFTLAPGTNLPAPGARLYVWTSSQTALFVQQAPLTVGADGTFSLTVAPDTLTTVSTVSTAAHGEFPDAPIPAPAPWALPYADDFSAYGEDAMARFFADQGGSWAVRGGALTQVGAGEPIAWAPNGDPLTMMGEEDWMDYAVSATAVFRPAAGGSGGAPRRRAAPRPRRGLQQQPPPLRSNTATAYVVPCDAADPAQFFTYDASTGYLGSAWQEPGCLTTCGCDPYCLQMWDCGVPGCGGIAYNWTFRGGLLLNEAYPDLALAAQPANSSLAMRPAGAGTTWAYNSSSKLLTAPALGLCVSQQKPLYTYVQVCGRLGQYNGFNPATTPAYCLALFESGEFVLLINSAPSSLRGNVTVPFDPRAPHRLTLNMAGPVIEGYINGTLVGSITDFTYEAGNAAVGSGWHPAAFDDFEVTPPL